MNLIYRINGYDLEDKEVIRSQELIGKVSSIESAEIIINEDIYNYSEIKKDCEWIRYKIIINSCEKSYIE